MLAAVFGWMGLAAGPTAYAQNGNGNGDGTATASIAVSAVVTATTDSEVSMITLRDMNIDAQVTRQGMVEVNPLLDAQAGQMRAEGRPNATVRISFLQQRELTRIGGPETLLFVYNISGNNLDDQASSEILELDNREFQLNDEGEFYFWIGGQVDIRNAVQGAYDGEFTIEIEYLET